MQTAYNAQYFRNKLNDFRRLMIMHMIAQLKREEQSITVSALHMLLNEVMHREYRADPMKWQDFLFMWKQNCESAWHSSNIPEDQYGVAEITPMGEFRLSQVDFGRKSVEFAILIGCQTGVIQRARKAGSLVTAYKYAA